MTTKVRNTDDEKSKAFWLAVQQSAEAARTAPRWTRAGIYVNAIHFISFSREETPALKALRATLVSNSMPPSSKAGKSEDQR